MKINLSEIKTPSNMLSLLRLLMAVPLWISLDYYQSAEMRIVIFSMCVFASFTDILDGFLARKRNEITEMGKVIDPLADKVAVGAVVIKLFLIGQIPLYYFAAIIGRDLIIFLGGIFVSNKLGRVLPSNVLGKITVITIGLVILMILLMVDRRSAVFIIFYWLSIFMMAISLIGYAYRANEFIKRKKEHGTV